MRRVLPVLVLLACTSENNPKLLDEPAQPYLALVIETPAPATWHEVGPTAVAGTYESLVDIRVGDGATTTTDTRFSAEVDLVRGTNLLQVQGTSLAGTVYSTHNSVIAGPLNDPDAPVRDAALVRVNEGGLTLIGQVAAELITAERLRPLLVTGLPIFTLDEVDRQVEVEVTSFDLGGTALQIGTDGSLRIVLSDLAVGAHVDGQFDRLSVSLDQTVSVDQAVLTGQLDVDVIDGILQVGVRDVDVVLTGFSLDTTQWPEWLTGTLTDLVLTTVVEGALEVAIVDVVPPLIQEQLNTLSLSFDTTLMERPTRLEATFTRAAFDQGLVLDTDLDVRIDGLGTSDAPGVLGSPASTPDTDRSADLAVTLADDLLNLAVFQAWRADLLTYTLATEDGSLPPYVLDALGGSRTGSVRVSADLPPTIIEHDGGLRAQIGELRVRLDTPGGDNGEYVILAVGGHIDLDLQVQGGVLKVGFGDKDLRLAVRETDWTTSLPAATEQIEKLLPLEVALALLSDLEIPLPTLAGLQVTSATTSRDPSGLHTQTAVRLERVAE